MKKFKKVMALGLIAASLAGFGLIGRSADACNITWHSGKIMDCGSAFCKDSDAYAGPFCDCPCHKAHGNEPVPCYCEGSCPDA